MTYDEHKQRQPSDMHGRSASELSRGDKRQECRDCGQSIEEGAHGTFTGTYCDEDWRWRAARGWEFDERTKAQLLAAERAA